MCPVCDQQCEIEWVFSKGRSAASVTYDGHKITRRKIVCFECKLEWRLNSTVMLVQDEARVYREEYNPYRPDDVRELNRPRRRILSLHTQETP